MQQQYEAAILAAENARNADLGGNLSGPGMGPGPVITLPDTKAETPVSSEVTTPDIAVDIPTSTVSPVVTAPPPTTFMQNFRPTRINPFTECARIFADTKCLCLPHFHKHLIHVLVVGLARP